MADKNQNAANAAGRQAGTFVGAQFNHLVAPAVAAYAVARDLTQKLADFGSGVAGGPALSTPAADAVAASKAAQPAAAAPAAATKGKDAATPAAPTTSAGEAYAKGQRTAPQQFLADQVTGFTGGKPVLNPALLRTLAGVSAMANPTVTPGQIGQAAGTNNILTDWGMQQDLNAKLFQAGKITADQYQQNHESAARAAIMMLSSLNGNPMGALLSQSQGQAAPVE